MAPTASCGGDWRRRSAATNSRLRAVLCAWHHQRRNCDPARGQSTWIHLVVSASGPSRRRNLRAGTCRHFVRSTARRDAHMDMLNQPCTGGAAGTGTRGRSRRCQPSDFAALDARRAALAPRRRRSRPGGTDYPRRHFLRATVGGHGSPRTGGRMSGARVCRRGGRARLSESWHARRGCSSGSSTRALPHS